MCRVVKVFGNYELRSDGKVYITKDNNFYKKGNEVRQLKNRKMYVLCIGKEMLHISETMAKLNVIKLHGEKWKNIKYNGRSLEFSNYGRIRYHRKYGVYRYYGYNPTDVRATYIYGKNGRKFIGTKYILSHFKSETVTGKRVESILNFVTKFNRGKSVEDMIHIRACKYKNRYFFIDDKYIFRWLDTSEPITELGFDRVVYSNSLKSRGIYFNKQVVPYSKCNNLEVIPTFNSKLKKEYILKYKIDGVGVKRYMVTIKSGSIFVPVNRSNCNIKFKCLGWSDLKEDYVSPIGFGNEIIVSYIHRKIYRSTEYFLTPREYLFRYVSDKSRRSHKVDKVIDCSIVDDYMATEVKDNIFSFIDGHWNKRKPSEWRICLKTLTCKGRRIRFTKHYRPYWLDTGEDVITAYYEWKKTQNIDREDVHNRELIEAI